jgi:hypothetical protein
MKSIFFPLVKVVLTTKICDSLEFLYIAGFLGFKNWSYFNLQCYSGRIIYFNYFNALKRPSTKHLVEMRLLVNDKVRYFNCIVI